VTALLAAGYRVFAINPLSVARYRERHSTSGAKSDAGDAHVLAEIVRLDRDHHRPVAGDSELADAVKLLARAHQTAIWERTRHVLRLRSTLLEFFPAAVEAFDDLAAADALTLLRRAPDPARAARLTRVQITAALRAARRHHADARADALLALLRAPGLRQPPVTEGAYAAVVTGQVRILTALNEQIAELQQVMAEHFGRHPAADIYLSQPGFGAVLAARALGEFGDDGQRFTDARARKNYSGQSPITRASGKKTVVLARYATNRRLGAALHLQAFAALSASPGARAYYDALRGRNIGHHAALRQLANRLVGILHGCLKTSTHYDEDTAWQHHRTDTQTAAA
jgi:transposase